MGPNGLTPLIAAATLGGEAVAETLLAAGADTSLRSWGLTAFDVAAFVGHLRVLAVLVRHGVDINDADERGMTALHRAAAANEADSIDFLVAAGGNMEARNEYEMTPLHCASAFGLEAVIALLKHGAVMNARDVHGQTPLHLAAGTAGKRGAMEIVNLLLQREADETAADHSNKTPADMAGILCSDIEDVEGVEHVRKLLANAPAARAARKAWRRRGLLVASKARPHMVFLGTSTRSRGEWLDLIGRVLSLAEEGVFRTIVGYL